MIIDMYMELQIDVYLESMVGELIEDQLQLRILVADTYRDMAEYRFRISCMTLYEAHGYCNEVKMGGAKSLPHKD